MNVLVFTLQFRQIVCFYNMYKKHIQHLNSIYKQTALKGSHIPLFSPSFLITNVLLLVHTLFITFSDSLSSLPQPFLPVQGGFVLNLCAQ